MVKLDDFLKLCEYNLENYDFDGAHAITWWLENNENICTTDYEESQIWLSILYMAFYNEASMLHYYLTQCDPTKLFLDTARRSLRGGKIQQHIDDWRSKVDVYGGFKAYLTHKFTGDPHWDWGHLLDAIENVYGCGRWASYGLADHLHKVNKFPVTPTCTGWRGSSGPRKGLERLREIGETLDQTEHRLIRILEERWPTVNFKYYQGPMDYGILESLCCDWAGLTGGTYYSGRNIDRLMVRMKSLTDVVGALGGRTLRYIEEARRAMQPHSMLGELNNWWGIDKERKMWYKAHGEVLRGDERRNSSR